MMNNSSKRKITALAMSLLAIVLILSVLMPTFSAAKGGIKGGNKNFGYGYGYVWDKSSLEVTGECDFPNAVAIFTISNTGNPGDGDMQGLTQYRIYINEELEKTVTFQLNGGESIEVPVDAGCNTIILLEADQRPGHPGNSLPQEIIKNCGCDD